MPATWEMYERRQVTQKPNTWGNGSEPHSQDYPDLKNVALCEAIVRSTFPVKCRSGKGYRIYVHARVRNDN